MSAMEKRCSTIKGHWRGPRAHYSQRPSTSPHADTWIGVLIKYWEAVCSSCTYPLFYWYGSEDCAVISLLCSAERGLLRLFVDDAKHLPGLTEVFLLQWAMEKKVSCVEWVEEHCKVEGAEAKCFPSRYEFVTKRKRTSKRTQQIFSLYGLEPVCSQAESLISRSMALFRRWMYGCCLAQIS